MSANRSTDPPHLTLPNTTMQPNSVKARLIQLRLVCMTLNEHCTCCFSKYIPLLSETNNTLSEKTNVTKLT
jgi:hypothetical protein